MPSLRKQQLAKTRALRAIRAQRREDMLEEHVSGADRAVIAKKHNVSLKTVSREIARALDQRRPEAPAHYVRVQIERLTRALQCVDRALLHGDVDSVPHLVRLLDKLDRYHALSPAAEPPRLACAAPPLALTHERTEIGA